MQTLTIITYAETNEIQLSVDGKYLSRTFPKSNVHYQSVIDLISDAYEVGFHAGCEHMHARVEDLISKENIQIQDQRCILGNVESLTV